MGCTGCTMFLSVAQTRRIAAQGDRSKPVPAATTASPCRCAAARRKIGLPTRSKFGKPTPREICNERRTIKKGGLRLRRYGDAGTVGKRKNSLTIKTRGLRREGGWRRGGNGLRHHASADRFCVCCASVFSVFSADGSLSLANHRPRGSPGLRSHGEHRVFERLRFLYTCISVVSICLQSLSTYISVVSVCLQLLSTWISVEAMKKYDVLSMFLVAALCFFLSRPCFSVLLHFKFDRRQRCSGHFIPSQTFSPRPSEGWGVTGAGHRRGIASPAPPLLASRWFF